LNLSAEADILDIRHGEGTQTMRFAVRVVKPAALLSLILVAAQGCAPPKSAVRRVREIVPVKVEVRKAGKDALVYTDRDYTMESVPAPLDGASFIATPCDMKRNGVQGVRFVLSRPAVVYVGYQHEGKTPPDWLAKNFKKTGLRIRVHQPANRWAKRKERRWHFDLYSFDCPAGVMALGPNAGEGVEGNPLHYIVVLQKGATARDACFEGPVDEPVAGTVRKGARPYVDRAYTLENVPPELVGAELVRVRQADSMTEGSAQEIAFSDDATVYVAYDAGSKSIPGWIRRAGFRKTELTVSIGSMVFYPDKPMAVYAKEAKAGDEVRVGANRDPGWSGWPMQYLVMVKIREEK
jgi:hypothetical protein